VSTAVLGALDPLMPLRLAPRWRWASFATLVSVTATRLLFVYNADGGALNGLRDIWHRVTSPSTCPCALCKVAYGAGRPGVDARCVSGTALMRARSGCLG